MSRQDEELLELWKTKEFTVAIFDEIKQNLHEKEMEMIARETKQLVAKNRALGGSEHGFYYKSELFVVAGAFGKEGIDILHPSLEEEAEYLRLNRIEVQQYTTYIAHFLGALERFAEGNPSTYCANLPQGLLQLSDSLNRFNIYCQRNDSEFYKSAAFNEEDKSKAAFFAHYNRVNNPITRFLFRRIAN